MSDLRENLFVCGMSRSGTTLLTTVLDSHPDVSMGYEMLPIDLPNINQMIELLEQEIDQQQGNVSKIGESLKQKGFVTLGTFVRRCYRTNVSPQEFVQILKAARARGELQIPTDRLEFRVAISTLVVEEKQRKEKAKVRGYKLNISAFEDVYRLLPDSIFVYILRDPRDVVSSHFKRNFNRTVPEITKAWNKYLENFLKLQKRLPNQAYLIQYESLVSHPDEAIAQLLDFCGLPYMPEARNFFQSDASIHKSRHANAEELSKDFFTSSVGRWKSELSLNMIREIEQACKLMMEKFGYRKASTAVIGVKESLSKKKAEAFIKKKKYNRDYYYDLILGNAANRSNLTWYEAITGQKGQGEPIFILRHDVDHDIETALRMAEWEHRHNIRATYCILHTAWYYGEFIDGKYHHYDLMIDTCKKIQDLGHEINLHNNFAVLALQTGCNPFDILEQELEFFLLHGVPIKGTSAHGEALCRELNFYNFELFSETVWESRGGRRTIAWENSQIELGSRSMKDFGLEYEAYDLPRDYYITDSGSNLRVRENTRGRGGIRLKEMNQSSQYAHVLGILTHPIWWDFENKISVDSELQMPRCDVLSRDQA